MSYNGSGTYVPPAGQPVATGTVIQSSTFNTLVADIGNTLNNVLPRDGQASMAGQLKLIDGTSSIPGIAFNSEASSGIYRPSAGMLALVASGVESLRINSGGRVLIGTNVDDGINQLQLNGSAKITGSLIGNVIGSVTGNVSGTALNVTGVVAVANGGTGATTASDALVNLGAASIASVPLGSSTAPAMNGMAAVGVGTTFARNDHVHPTDTSRAPIASPTFTGTVTATTFSGALTGNATNVTGTVAVANGGTGATTAAAARSALGVAATDGTGATGTWPVSITGNAGTATTLNALANYAYTSAQTPSAYPAGIQSFFVQGADGWPNYGSVMNVKTYGGGGGSLQMYTPYSPANGGNVLRVRFGNFDVAGGNSWTGWKTLLSDDSPANITYTQAGNIMNLVNTTTAGVQINMLGNGANPAKTLRVQSGNFEVINSAYNGVIMSLSDAGNLQAPTITQTSGHLE